MKDDNGKIEPQLLSSTCNCFLQTYKELIKKVELLKQDGNMSTKKENNKLFKKERINKYKLQTKSKLPLIRNYRNNNFNLIKYLQNTNSIINNNNKLKSLSPKNNLFNFGPLLKKEKLIYYNKKVDINNNNSYTKSPQENKNKTNNSLINRYFKKSINNIKFNMEENSFNNKIDQDLNNSNLNSEKKNSLLKGNSINISSKKNIKIKNVKFIINKNKSTDHFNILKLNANNNSNNNNKIKINIIKRNDNTPLIKVPKKMFKSENVYDTINNNNSNSNMELNELKYSNSDKSIILTKNNSNTKLKKIKDENVLTVNNSNKKYFIVYPGNNSKLIENVILTRPNWDYLPHNKRSKECNFLWTPLSIQINYSFHKSINESHIVNHFEFQNEISNKSNTFINLLKYCEINDINLFSFYPLTIILPLNNDNYNITLENFKNCYFDIPNLIEDPENKNPNFLNKYYRNYFHVKSNLKLGCIQKLVIPKTHYAMKNLWLLKRTNLNRGREIKIFDNLENILIEINQIKNEHKIKNLIIQKYIEKPLLYDERKFDIRIWVLFTYMLKTNRFDAYVFKEGHLKASSEIFDINSLNIFIHLTNYSVQKYSKNFSKNEIGNEISFSNFQKELDTKNNGINFKRDIFGKIIKIIGITANIAKNKINNFNRKNCFEIFGYDFILDEEYNPFLLEINTNPGYEESSPVIKMLVPRMIDDALRLTIDKTFERNDKYKNCSKYSVNHYNDEENMWQKIKL